MVAESQLKFIEITSNSFRGLSRDKDTEGFVEF